MKHIQDNIRTIYCDLPNTVKSFTVATPDGFFTVVLNENLSYEQNLLSYYHELKHIQDGDFNKTSSVGLIEISAHGI